MIPWINKGPSEDWLDIRAVEKRKSCVYVADLTVEQKNGGWCERPMPIFYVAKPERPEYSNYFGLFQDFANGNLMITNGISAAKGFWNGAQADNGEIIFSRFRHDYRESADGTVMVDGGRDYFKCRCREDQYVRLVLDGPDFRVIHKGPVDDDES